MPSPIERIKKLSWRNYTPRPARTIATLYLSLIGLGTMLLALPFSRTDAKVGPFIESLFTSVSAVCITGLSTVNVETNWSPFGHLVIILLVKIGGLGILAMATLLGALFARRIGMKTLTLGATESSNMSFGNIGDTVRKIVLVSSAFEFVVSVALTLRWHFGYGYDLGKAIWYGTFHSVSAFNNAGFALYSDGLIRFQSDPWLLLPLCFNVIVGSLGFFVVFELGRRLIGRVEARRVGGLIESKIHWTLTTRIVLWSSAALLVLGTIFFLVVEYENSKTLGQMGFWSKLLTAFAMSVFTRSAGFNSIDISQLDPAALMGTDILMFIGGGSGSTAGGIKLTTAAVLLFIVWTEIRGGLAVNMGSRRLPRSIQRQALTLISLSFLVVIASVMFLQVTTSFTTDQILFEVMSAFGTVGLSTGILPNLPLSGQIVIMILMFIGRLGTVVVASSLAARVTHVHFEYPKERPIIG